MERGMIFRTKKENINSFIEKNEGVCIVYGATVWGELFASEDICKVDYFCDKKAKEIQSLRGIPVVGSDQLEGLIKESGKRALIIVCVGTNKETVGSIYRDLVKLKIEADIFDYFENAYVFAEDSFEMNQKKYMLYEHSYNCGYADSRMTERCVELALAKIYIETCKGDITEVGAVTPYYFEEEKVKDIIDPTDVHVRVNYKKSLFDCDLRGKNVLSISTVEHIGLGDYGLAENWNVIDAIEKIVNESKTCMITAPLGYNEMLDEWVRNNTSNFMIKILKRGINNHWVEMKTKEFEKLIYTPLWANGVVIIEK